MEQREAGEEPQKASKPISRISQPFQNVLCWLGLFIPYRYQNVCAHYFVLNIEKSAILHFRLKTTQMQNSILNQW